MNFSIQLLSGKSTRWLASSKGGSIDCLNHCLSIIKIHNTDNFAGKRMTEDQLDTKLHIVANNCELVRH